MTIKEFYRQNFQLITVTNFSQTSELKLNTEYRPTDEIKDPMLKTHHRYAIVKNNAQKENPRIIFDNFDGAIEYIKAHRTINL